GMEGKADQSYKTLYLLHGMSDDHTIWQRRTSIERYASAYGIAVVMPAANLSWYTDMDCGYSNYFTFISKELPFICRDFFPKMSTKREDTFIAGLSMGGYGAVKCALAESETFGKAASLSGAFDIKKRSKSKYGLSVFGADSEKHEIDTYAKALAQSQKPKPELFIWCGTEDGLLEINHEKRDMLVSLGYNVSYSESTGSHCWESWDEQIVNALRFFAK
ncbi:MAG: alpha/beta hydrolase family protein, partial [Clostridia bacterium]